MINSSRDPRILLRAQALSKNPLGVRNRQQYPGTYKFEDVPRTISLRMYFRY